MRNSTPPLVRDLAALTGGQLVSKLIGFVAFAMLARTLDPEGYGAVEYMVGIAALFGAAINGGLGTIAVKRIAEAPDELPLLAARVPLARLLIALAAIPVMIVAVKALGSPSIPHGLVWLYAASLFFAVWNQDWLLQSAELMTSVAAGQLLRVLVFVGLVLLLVRDPADLVAVGWAELAACAVMSLYYVRVQHHEITPFRPVFLPAGSARLIREAAPLGLSPVIWSAAQYAPLLLLGSLVGGASVGWFAATQRLIISLAAFSFVYHFNLYPALTRASASGRAALAQLLRISFRVTAWVSIGATLGLSLAATLILSVIYGESFETAASALRVLVWVIPITFLSGHARWALTVIGAQSSVLRAQLAGLTAAVLGGIPLVSLLGHDGAAIAALGGAGAVWMASHVAARRQQASPPPLSLAARPLGLALLLELAAQFSDLGMLLEAIGGLLIYIALAPFVDRALPSDLMRLVHVKSAATRPA